MKQGEQYDAGDAEHADYQGVENVYPQREPDKAAEKIDDEEAKKAEERVDQQLEYQADGLGQYFQQENADDDDGGDDEQGR